MSNTLVGFDPAGPAICQHPVFIIGSPRSGTSILAWSLAQHSQLWTSAESDILYYLFGRGHLEKAYETACARPDGTWMRNEGVDRSEFCRYLGLGLNALFTSRSGGRRWIDQTPLYTLMVDVLAELFPGALFLHILRDGRRVVDSMVNFENNLGPDLKAEMAAAGRLPLWASDFANACTTWSRFVDTALAFGASDPARCLTITNEALTENPRHTFGEIFGFLQVDFEEAPMNYVRKHRINSSFPQQDPARPAAPGRAVDPWDLWSDDQRETFKAIAGPTLTKCGSSGFELSGPSSYESLVHRIRRVVSSALPTGACILVVSKGDEALLNIESRKAQHFPQGDCGVFAGHYPESSAEAIAQLERLRANGAEFLVVPRTSTWWLDYYVEFRQHLERGNSAVLRDESCTIFALQASSAIAKAGDDERQAIRAQAGSR